MNQPVTRGQAIAFAIVLCLASVSGTWGLDQKSTSEQNNRDRVVCIATNKNRVESNRRWAIVQKKLHISDKALKPYKISKC